MLEFAILDPWEEAFSQKGGTRGGEGKSEAWLSEETFQPRQNSEWVSNTRRRNDLIHLAHNFWPRPEIYELIFLTSSYSMDLLQVNSNFNIIQHKCNPKQLAHCIFGKSISRNSVTCNYNSSKVSLYSTPFRHELWAATPIQFVISTIVIFTLLFFNLPKIWKHVRPVLNWDISTTTLLNSYSYIIAHEPSSTKILETLKCIRNIKELYSFK